MLSAEEITHFIRSLIPTLERAGFCVEEAKAGYVKVKIPLSENNNHLGGIYAGSLFFLAEGAGAALFATVLDPSKYRKFVATKADITYISPAFSDVWTEITAKSDMLDSIEKQCIESKKAFYTLNMILRDEKKETIAEVNITYCVKPAKSDEQM